MNSITRYLIIVSIALTPTTYGQSTPGFGLQYSKVSKEINSLYIETITDIIPGKNASELEEFGIDTKPMRTKFKYWRMGEKFKYEITDITSEGEKPILIHSYDSERYQYWVPEEGGRLVISSKTLGALFLETSNYAFLPLTFINNADKESWGMNPITPDLEDIQNIVQWNEAFKDSIFRKITDGTSYEISRKAERGGEKHSLKYLVQFTKFGEDYPSNIKKMENNVTLLDMDILSIDKASIKKDFDSIFFPKTILSKHYTSEGKHAYDLKIFVKSFICNKEAESFDFTIDPSIAKVIYDRDTNKTIWIPK